MRLFRNREYKSGSRWAFWRWTEVPSDFILRLHILKTPWFAICIHWLNKPDPEPYLHDHPITFLSLVLRGWYKEWREKRIYTEYIGHQWQMHQNHVVNRHNYIRASLDDKHTIKEVSPGGCVTLCFMGPKTREWGYHTPEGWVHWKVYNNAKYKRPTQ